MRIFKKLLFTMICFCLIEIYLRAADLETKASSGTVSSDQIDVSKTLEEKADMNSLVNTLGLKIADEEEKSDVTDFKNDDSSESLQPAGIDLGLNLPIKLSAKAQKMKRISSDDIAQSQFIACTDLIKQMTKMKQRLTSNQATIVYKGMMDNNFPDTIATNKRIANLDQATRTTMKNMLKVLKKPGTTIGKLIGSKPMDPTAFTEKLIQAQLDNVFGTDSMSGQSLFSFDKQTQADLVAKFRQNEEYKKLFDASVNLSEIDQLRLIAKMGDEVMNRLAGDVALFDTTLNDDGSYVSNISSTAATGEIINLSSTIDNSGRIKYKSFLVADNKISYNFLTIFDDQGVQRTSIINNGNTTVLNSDEAEMADQVAQAHKNMIIFKSAVKAMLYLGKQVALNIPGLFISMKISLIASVVVIGVIKPVSLIMGYDFKEPTLRATLLTLLEVGCGDRRAFLSNDPDRIFVKGGIISNALQIIQGKSTEDADLNEEYYTWITPVSDAVQLIINKIAPETLGDQLVSAAGLVPKNNVAVSIQ